MTIKTLFQICDQTPLNDLFNDMDITLWETLLQQVARFLDCPAVGLILTSDVGYQNIALAKTDDITATPGKIIPREVNIYCKEVYDTKKQFYINNASNVEKWQDNPELTMQGFVSYLGFPIKKRNGEIFATLCALDTKETNYNIQQVDLMGCIRDIIQRELHTAEQLAEVRHESHHDELTQVLNRRGLIEKYQALLKSQEISNNNLAIIYFDLDGLKVINDTWGHGVGDAYISGFAQALKDALRGSDLCARLGGDEFVAFCSSSRPIDVDKIIERITEHYEAICASLTVPCNAAFSAGILNYPVPPKDINSALEIADKQMYENKRRKAQRGQICS
ncbi:diguanylate cyclase domain-containing protein [Vibrio sp. TBV020]|uniref:sensor domain-containing diguanylate cyclase n=1 Tax=Vibrio sp. TBV020 TaxID=3137398 RepID=UPI0038CDC550